MPLTAAFPSSAAFDTINSSLQSNAAERKDAVKKGNAIFAFTIKNGQGQTESWYIDLKEKGEVAKGEAPEGKKADGESCHGFYDSYWWFYLGCYVAQVVGKYECQFRTYGVLRKQRMRVG